MRDYCTQNQGDCSTCSLVNYGHDCQNNKVDSEAKRDRLAKLAVMDAAKDFESEQSAIAACRVVDIRPTMPGTVADLYHQWAEREHPEDTREYQAACKALGAAFDRGARRYYIKRTDARNVYDALRAEGFCATLHPSLV
jgi:hypothetical protein